jgi:hypothetical protein
MPRHAGGLRRPKSIDHAMPRLNACIVDQASDCGFLIN